ncbi:MAG: hypothetical protein AAB569_05065 [Patescibacteria group bacterium]
MDIKNHERKHRRRLNYPLIGLITIGFLTGVACFSTLSSPTITPTQPSTIGRTYHISQEASYMYEDERIFLGDPISLDWLNDGRLLSVNAPSVIDHPCNAEPSLIQKAQSLDPYNSEDIRKAICLRFEKLGRKIGLPEESISTFALYMATNTVSIDLSAKDSQIICDGAPAYNKNGKIFILSDLNTIDHETVHHWYDQIPDGIYYVDESNQQFCILHKNVGLTTIIFSDESTDLTNPPIYQKAKISEETIPILSEVQTTGTFGYRGNFSTTLQEDVFNFVNAIQGDPLLKILVGDDILNGKPTIDQLVKIFINISRVKGIREFILLDERIQEEKDRGSISESRIPSQLSPQEACGQ